MCVCCLCGHGRISKSTCLYMSVSSEQPVDHWCFGRSEGAARRRSHSSHASAEATAPAPCMHHLACISIAKGEVPMARRTCRCRPAAQPVAASVDAVALLRGRCTAAEGLNRRSRGCGANAVCPAQEVVQPVVPVLHAWRVSLWTLEAPATETFPGMGPPWPGLTYFIFSKYLVFIRRAGWDGQGPHDECSENRPQARLVESGRRCRHSRAWVDSGTLARVGCGQSGCPAPPHMQLLSAGAAAARGERTLWQREGSTAAARRERTLWQARHSMTARLWSSVCSQRRVALKLWSARSLQVQGARRRRSGLRSKSTASDWMALFLRPSHMLTASSRMRSSARPGIKGVWLSSEGSGKHRPIVRSLEGSLKCASWPSCVSSLWSLNE